MFRAIWVGETQKTEELAMIRTLRVRMVLFCLIVLVISLMLLVPTMQLPGNSEVTTRIGPRFWPFWILVLLAASSGLQLVLSFFSDAYEERPASREREASETRSWMKASTHIVVFLATVIYIYAMVQVGYLITTPIFACVVSAVLGERSIKRLALTTVAAAVIVSVVFDFLLEIPLP